MRVNFSEVSVQSKKSGKCAVCRKRMTKSMAFYQTVNPWNKDSSGNIKTKEAIYAELKQLADNWIPDFTHEKCK